MKNYPLLGRSNPKNSLPNFTGFGFLPAIRVGALDGINLGAATVVLVLIVFLFFVAGKDRSLTIHGWCFLAGVGVVKVFLDNRLVDQILGFRAASLALDIGYFLLSIFFIVLGSLLLRDWLIFKKDKQEKSLLIKFPFMLAGRRPREKKRYFRNLISQDFIEGIFSVLVGMVVAITALAWPADLYVNFIFYHFSLPGKFLHAFFVYSSYLFSFLLIQILVLSIAIYISNSKLWVNRIKSAFSLIQIIAAAILAGFGTALLWMQV